MSTSARELFISDIHFPIHDVEAWSLILHLVKCLKFDHIVLGGDLLDGYALTMKYLRDPLKIMSFGEEIKVAQENFQSLRNVAGETPIHLLYGNHDLKRYQEYLKVKAPEISNLDEFSLDNLLKLHSFGIVHESPGFRIGQLRHFHGHEVALSSVNPAKTLYDRIHLPSVIGHFHRFDTYFVKDFEGNVCRTWVSGTLIDCAKIEYALHTEWNVGGIYFHHYDLTKCPIGYNLEFYKHKGYWHCNVGNYIYNSKGQVIDAFS